MFRQNRKRFLKRKDKKKKEKKAKKGKRAPTVFEFLRYQCLYRVFLKGANVRSKVEKNGVVIIAQ